MKTIEGGQVRKTEIVTWVVYQMTLRNKTRQAARHAVCERSEWEAMELSRPGYHTLIRADIASEVEAERVARGMVDGLIVP